MSRIIPQEQKVSTKLPSWMDPKALLDASKREEQVNALQKDASTDSLKRVETVSSYVCESCSQTFQASNPKITAQVRLAQRQASGQNVPEIRLSCECGGNLKPYQWTSVRNESPEVRYAAQFEAGTGTYNTTIDRHIVYKAVQALQDFAMSKGMTMARARVISAEHAKMAGQEYPTINNIECEIEWTFAPKQKARVFASMVLDPAGKFRLPKVFKTADKQEYPFDAETISGMEKSAELFKTVPDKKLRKTDSPVYRKPDPTRFRAASLGKAGEPSQNPKDAVRQAYEGITSNYQLSNPVLNKLAQFNSLSIKEENKAQLIALAERLFEVSYPDDAEPVKESTYQDRGDVLRAIGSNILWNLSRSTDVVDSERIAAELANEMGAVVADPFADIESFAKTLGYTTYPEDKGFSAVKSDRTFQFFPTRMGFGVRESQSSQSAGLSHADVRSFDTSEKDEFVQHAKTILQNAGGVTTTSAATYPTQQFNPAPAQYAVPPTTMMQQQPEYQVGEQVVNPLDGKTYQVADKNPTGGTTVLDTQTGKQLAVPKGDESHLKRVLQTSLESSVVTDQDLREHLTEDVQTSHNEIDVLREIIDTEKDSIQEDQEMLSDIRGGSLQNPWQSRRDAERKKSEEEKKASQVPVRIEKEPRQVTAARELGFRPEDTKADATGHSVTGIPLGETKAIEVGLTEFPKDQERGSGDGYTIPFAKMDENQVEERENFRNREKLPAYKTLKREELGEYGLGKERKDVNYGPTRPDQKTTVSTAEDTALLRAIGMNVEAAEAPVVQPVAENAVRIEKPIQHKVLKTAPKEETFKEPEAIPGAAGKVKEAITKLRTAQKDIDAIKKQLQEKSAPIEDLLRQQREPLEKELAGKESIVKSLIQMIFAQLQSFESTVVAYEDAIVAAHEFEGAVAPSASVAQILTEAERVSPELAESIRKLKAVIENRSTQNVLNRFLYEYPISNVQQKKISADVPPAPGTADIGTADDEDRVIRDLKEWLMDSYKVLSDMAQSLISVTA